VATIADEYDEKLVNAYGGETALDCLRGKKLRKSSAAARKAGNN